MDSLRKHASSGFSPDIAISLEMGVDRFNVASIGGNQLRLRQPHVMPAGPGVIYLNLDGRLLVHHVHLPDGIDPSRNAQPFVMVSAGEEAVA